MWSLQSSCKKPGYNALVVENEPKVADDFTVLKDYAKKYE
jgi:hypothetical protein